MFRFLTAVLAAAKRADILYVNGLAGPEMAAVLAGKLLAKPVVLKIVGDNAWELAIRRGWTNWGIDEFQQMRPSPKAQLVRRLVRQFAQLATKLIVPSEYLKRIVSGWGVPPKKIAVIRNALTLVEEQNRSDSGIALGPGRLIVTCARLYPWKNIEFLIRLLPDLPPDVKLAIVGDGPERDRLEREAVNTGVLDRVHFAGSVSQSTVQEYLRAADIFTLHTRYEGLSHVILEAMHACTPIVASEVGGNPEVIISGRNGLLVPLNDHHMMVSTLQRLLDDPTEGRKLAAVARNDVQSYRWDLLLDRTISTLTDVHRIHRSPKHTL